MLTTRGAWGHYQRNNTPSIVYQTARREPPPMGIMMKLAKWTFFACVFGLHFSSSAQVYEGCNDIRNIPVASISDYSVQDIAVAMLAPNGAPLIRYNQNVVSSVAPQTRVFFYMHECGHHALGHNFGTTHQLRVEQDADCFAIRTMVGNGMVNDSDIRVIQADLYSKARGDWSHLPGPQRAINLRECLGNTSRLGPSSNRRAKSEADSEGESNRQPGPGRNVIEESTPHSYKRPTDDDAALQRTEPLKVVREIVQKSESGSELSSCTAKLRCEIDTLEQVCNCRTTIAAIAKEEGLNEAKKAKLTGEKCYSGQYDIRTCWANANATLARATCTTVLEDGNKAIPAPKPGSCLANTK
jgi:hypothetical protein